MVPRLREEIRGSLGGEARVVVVGDHASARRGVAAYLAEGTERALIVAGGGSGTMRAVIEGACGVDGTGGDEVPGPERVVLGALRMGSGNPLARYFGAPKDPVAALRGVVSNALAGRIVPLSVMRCEVGTRGGGVVVRYGATMSGFGEFGRVPGDLERLHDRAPRARAASAWIFGVENVNRVEYAVAMLVRAERSVAPAGRTEMVEVVCGGRRERMRLLAGVAVNLPVEELPVGPCPRAEAEAVIVHLVPRRGPFSGLRLVLRPKKALRDAVSMGLERGSGLEITLLDRGTAGFFLDEDPMEFHGRLVLGIAGMLAFAPGPGYRFEGGSR